MDMSTHNHIMEYVTIATIKWCIPVVYHHIASTEYIYLVYTCMFYLTILLHKYYTDISNVILNYII